MRHDGYSPNQHVLGMELQVPGLNKDIQQEIMDSAILQGEPNYVRSQEIREAARKAMPEVDSIDRLKRATEHRTKPQRGPYLPKTR